MESSHMESSNTFYKRLIEPAIQVSNHHLQEANVSYATHFIQANLIGCRMVFGGLSAIVHAIFPFACRRTASTVCRQIVDEIDTHVNDNPDKSE